jgi:uncharacterized membrane protein YgaE (UPF0421/DUF939 family)
MQVDPSLFAVILAIAFILILMDTYPKMGGTLLIIIVFGALLRLEERKA